MLDWQKDILRRFGEQEESPLEAEIRRFSTKVEELAQHGNAADIRRMKLKEPCLPCMNNRR